MKKRSPGLAVRGPDPRDNTPPFDWERLAQHVATICADLAAEPTWTFRDPDAQHLWGIVHDPFGKTLYGCDVAHQVGSIAQIGEARMEWHGDAIVLVFARILRQASHREAERLAHK